MIQDVKTEFWSTITVPPPVYLLKTRILSLCTISTELDEGYENIPRKSCTYRFVASMLISSAGFAENPMTIVGFGVPDLNMKLSAV